jgi:hypothetical protein
MTMKRTVLFGALLLCLGLASCQCADPPPVGPVDDDQAQVLTVPGGAEAHQA